jgi:hypothetical protein
MKKEKRFILHLKKKKLGSFDTYEDACNYVEHMKPTEMIYCSIKDTKKYVSL